MITPFPRSQDLRYFYEVASAAQEEQFGRFHGVVGEQVDQPANHANATGQDEVKRFFAEKGCAAGYATPAAHAGAQNCGNYPTLVFATTNPRNSM